MIFYWINYEILLDYYQLLIRCLWYLLLILKCWIRWIIGSIAGIVFIIISTITIWYLFYSSFMNIIVVGYNWVDSILLLLLRGRAAWIDFEIIFFIIFYFFKSSFFSYAFNWHFGTFLKIELIINNIIANPLNILIHIVPEWYFLLWFGFIKSFPIMILGLLFLLFIIFYLLLLGIRNLSSISYSITNLDYYSLSYAGLIIYNWFRAYWILGLSLLLFYYYFLYHLYLLLIILLAFKDFLFLFFHYWFYPIDLRGNNNK